MAKFHSMNALALCTSLAALAAPLAAAAVTVQIDQTTPVHTSSAVGSVVVGNPSIADVNVIDARTIAVLGRSYGQTNVIVMDRMGRQIMNASINVAGAQSGHVSLYRGPNVYNFACSPRCERTPMPGENKDGVYDPYAQAYSNYGERTKADAPGSAGAGSSGAN